MPSISAAELTCFFGLLTSFFFTGFFCTTCLAKRSVNSSSSNGSSSSWSQSSEGVCLLVSAPLPAEGTPRSQPQSQPQHRTRHQHTRPIIPRDKLLHRHQDRRGGRRRLSTGLFSFTPDTSQDRQMNSHKWQMNSHKIGQWSLSQDWPPGPVSVRSHRSPSPPR